MGVITREELETLLIEIRAENSAYPEGRGEVAEGTGHQAAMYSMRRLAQRMHDAGIIRIESSKRPPAN